MNLGSSLELREDFFAYSFMFKLKRKSVFFDDQSSEDEEESDGIETDVTDVNQGQPAAAAGENVAEE